MLALARLGATAILSAERGYGCDVEDILRRVTARTRLVYLANPNNPTGSVVSTSDIARLRAELPAKIVLVIDAAHAECVRDRNYTAGHDLVAAGTRTVALRTFSKAFGFPGLRIGWAHRWHSIERGTFRASTASGSLPLSARWPTRIL